MELTQGQIRELQEVRRILQDIEDENYYYGPREDKCKLGKALIDRLIEGRV